MGTLFKYKINISPIIVIPFLQYPPKEPPVGIFPRVSWLWASQWVHDTWKDHKLKIKMIEAPVTCSNPHDLRQGNNKYTADSLPLTERQGVTDWQHSFENLCRALDEQLGGAADEISGEGFTSLLHPLPGPLEGLWQRRINPSQNQNHKNWVITCLFEMFEWFSHICYNL